MLGGPIAAVVARLGQPSLRDLRALLWGGLQRHHPALTLHAAGDLLHAALRGGESSAAALGEQIAAAIAEAFPPPPSPAGTPATKTGPSSTRRRSKPASKPAAPGA